MGLGDGGYTSRKLRLAAVFVAKKRDLEQIRSIYEGWTKCHERLDDECPRI